MNVIIYDITQDPEQVCLKIIQILKEFDYFFLRLMKLFWACQKLESIINELDHQITFILLSTVMTWAKTQPNEV